VCASIALACEDPITPFEEVDGVLAFTDHGTIHVLDLSDGYAEIIHSAVAGTEIRNLTWSPDGTSLVFSTFSFGQHTQFIREWKMYRISAEGSDMTLMFDRAGAEMLPAYAPDGRLAYWSDDGLYIDGWLISGNAAGEDGSAPSWSPGGSHIAYTAGVELFTLSIEDTSEMLSLLEDSDLRSPLSDPAYSPDGSRIAYVRQVSASEKQIWVVNIDGSQEMMLTDRNIDSHPAWSSDGSKIAFVRNGNAIYTAETTDGGEVQMLLRHPIEHLAWSW